MADHAKIRVNKANRKTPAARYNVKVMRELESKLWNEPEADIAQALSQTYSNTLNGFKKSASLPRNGQGRSSSNDIRHRLNIHDSLEVIFELSQVVKQLTCGYASLQKAIVQLIDDSEVIYESAWAASVMVFRINESLVVKAGHLDYSMTEHRTLAFLREHLPCFPVPRPQGLICLGAYSFLFTSYVPGTTLEKLWPDLNKLQKSEISGQLEELLTQLRSVPFVNGTSLGDVAGGGCRDSRRSQRVSHEPIKDVKSFEDFIFAGSKTASPLYIDFLRNLQPREPGNIVLTHGDIRPANIMVVREDNGLIRIKAIIDWESSGSYPDYWEAIKATNTLTPRDDCDWYEFIPESISAARYPIQWLVDRVFGRSLSNA